MRGLQGMGPDLSFTSFAFCAAEGPPSIAHSPAFLLGAIMIVTVVSPMLGFVSGHCRSETLAMSAGVSRCLYVGSYQMRAYVDSGDRRRLRVTLGIGHLASPTPRHQHVIIRCSMISSSEKSILHGPSYAQVLAIHA